MSSHIAQLALVDFLFVRIAQRRGDDITDPLQRTFEVTKPNRLSADARPTAGPTATRRTNRAAARFGRDGRESDRSLDILMGARFRLPRSKERLR